MSERDRIITDKINQIVNYQRVFTAFVKYALSQFAVKSVNLSGPATPASRIVPAARPQSVTLHAPQRTEHSPSPFGTFEPFAKDIVSDSPEHQPQTTEETTTDNVAVEGQVADTEQATSPELASEPEQPVDVGPAEAMGWEPSEEELLGGISKPLDVPAPIDFLPTGPESFLDDEEPVNPGFAGDEPERERAPGIADDPESQMLYLDLGTAVSPKALYCTLEGAFTAQSDTWDQSSQGANDGVTLCLTTRVAYDHTASPPVLYGFYRQFKYDSNGFLMTVSAETRYTIDDPGPCP